MLRLFLLPLFDACIALERLSTWKRQLRHTLRWTCVYPIYIDAKRAYGTGERRIARAKSVWWPLSKDIAEATNRLGLGTLHEMNKSHPRDWENPGRVRVQWKKDGRLVNPAIKSSAYTPPM